MTHALHQHARPGAGSRLQRRRSCRASRPTAACTCRQSWPQHSRCSLRRRERRLPEVAERLHRAVRRRRSARAAAAGDHRRDAFDFPAPLVPLATDGAPERARAVPRPDRGVQGFRRALSRGVAWRGCARGSDRPLQDSGGHLGRHRRRGRRGVPQSPGHRRVRAVSRRAWSRRRRSASSPAGAATCARSRCAARSTIASAS